MRSFISFIALLVIGVTLIEAAPHDHGHGKASSYAIVTKHEDSHGGHHGHGYDDHGYGHHSEYHGHVEHHGHAGGYGSGHHDDSHDYHSYPEYEFSYGVKDSKTGDVKDQWESRDGDKVKGSYSLKESDGTTRVVNYSSDKKNGFEATVHKIGHAHHDEQSHHDYGHHGHSEYSHSGHGKATSYVSVKSH
ncbi:adult-specific cuticular protein ACP-22-like [Musca domestica]|uniref:Adult-specific cuticular protein ACP-22-like n=1 Tax=Musca domestica TaxID=7370 RepID=A0ABM3UR33_MUSDO|nr:adult-specific cuticular protein ACP-22-like [Musca domestica]